MFFFWGWGWGWAQPQPQPQPQPQFFMSELETNLIILKNKIIKFYNIK